MWLHECCTDAHPFLKELVDAFEVWTGQPCEIAAAITLSASKLAIFEITSPDIT